MQQSGDLSDIRNYLYDRVELKWWWSLGISLAAQILSLIAIFINQGWFLLLAGFIAVIAPIIVIILREWASTLLQKADKCRRLILYADALGTEIPQADLATVRGWTTGIQLSAAPFISPYYSSQLPTGSQRLVDIAAESAFFTWFLAGKAASYLLAILAVSFLLLIAIIYAASTIQSNPNLSGFQSIAKAVLIIFPSIVFGEISLLCKKYSELQSSADKAFERCSALRDQSNLPIEEAMQVVEDYHLALIQSPPLPLKLYLTYRDKLNDKYRDTYHINPNQP